MKVDNLYGFRRPVWITLCGRKTNSHVFASFYIRNTSRNENHCFCSWRAKLRFLYNKNFHEDYNQSPWKLMSGKRDSNSRPQPWQGCALPTELFPQTSEEEETRTPTSQLTLPPQSSASTNSAISPTYFKHFIDHCIPLCPEQDSNLHASRHTHLKRARLPIPPPGHR